MKSKLRKRTSANDLYNHYTVRENLIKYENGFYVTEGINDIALYENCFWLIDIICHHKINFDIEFWKFSRENNNKFLLSATNKRDSKFVELQNLESDFYFDDLTIIKKGKLLCLPIEDYIY